MSVINSQTASRAAAITKSDTGAHNFSAVYVGGGGDVSVVTAGGDTVTFAGVQAGTILPVQISRVRSTGTTATNLVGLSQ